MAEATPRVYLSFDIEADGDSPAKNSMVSFGVVAFDEQGKEVHKYQANIKPRVGAVQGKRCMEEFWAKNPEVWKFVQTNQKEPAAFVAVIARMIEEHHEAGFKIVWLANPAAYDWQWLKAYYELYKEDSYPDIGYSAKCIGSMWTNKCRRMGWSSLEDHLESGAMKSLQAKDHVEHNPEHDARVQGLFYFKHVRD